jgi:S1-C subfamily serine protease
VNHLTRVVGDLKPGDLAAFTVIRDGASRDIQVRIEARTNEVAADNRKLWPGIHLIPLTDEIRSQLQIDKNAKGLYVAEVIADSPASVIGMSRGDLINSVNGENVRDLASYYKVLREKTGSELYFGFTRSGSTLESLKFKR